MTLDIPSLGKLPVKSEEKSKTLEEDDVVGPELKMNIFNMKKVQEVSDTEKPFQDEEDEEMKESDPSFNHTNTSVTEARNNKFKRIISEIVDGLVYLGSDFMAQDKSALLETGITHIINCSGDWSKNYHEDTFKYKRYHLKDHPIENIECVFYDAIDFIEEC